MARAHCDQDIKPMYVREVCRLMRTSNINIVKGDIEFTEIQDEINKERQILRQAQQEEDLEMPGAGEQNPGADTGKKVKISFDEFSRTSFMIISIMKEFERQGEENVRQQDIVEKMVQRIELDGADSVNRQTNVERAAETAKKVQNVISHLITNEGILVISQDAKVKNDRYLTLNMNLDIETLAGQLQSGAKEIY
jgi:hypothetical protein